MNDRTLSQGAWIVLAVGIVTILIGLLFQAGSAAANLFRGAGVIVTLIGMVSMVAARQNVTESSPLTGTTLPSSQLSSQDH